MASEDVSAPSLATYGLRVVLFDIGPGKARHQVIERREFDPAWLQQDRVVLRKRRASCGIDGASLASLMREAGVAEGGN